ncbi:hypothetical protein COV28_02350 [candidate division WWE3 bacterium CG10_big_fil_rev_8_21_14_0_10_48_23]|nr:MAG: hypothetical protein COY35_00595 [candidate division WWE3 bacterium CG_4_10_14_0_2_um_filter_47_8]PJE51418.1 MAG: hypothetical protein COV28_02350 [candidate division WWE3 bacterium CG10_big_fil_rev_8_21_14_0_10_48_23]
MLNLRKEGGRDVLSKGGELRVVARAYLVGTSDSPIRLVELRCPFCGEPRSGELRPCFCGEVPVEIISRKGSLLLAD